MKRARTSRDTNTHSTRAPAPEGESLRRKLPQAERDRMQVDDEGGQPAGERRKLKNLPRPKARYIPCAPPDFSCLNSESPGGIASTQHITIDAATMEQAPLGTAMVKARLNGSTSTPLPENLQGDNPHWEMSPSEENPSATTIPFTANPLPKIVYRASTVLGNVKDTVKKKLEEKRDSTVMLIPMGAGNRFTQGNPRYPDQVLTFLRTLRGAEGSKITIAPPTSQFTPPAKARFALPFAYIAGNVPSGLRETLIRRQTFAFQIDGKKYAFHAVAVPNEAPTSWVIANFDGGCVTSDINEMKKALEAILNTLFNDDTFTRQVNGALSKKNVGKSVLERKVVALSSMSLTYIPRKDEKGRETPIWQLAGRPIHDNPKDHRQWLKIIRRTTFDIGDMKTLTATKDQVGGEGSSVAGAQPREAERETTQGNSETLERAAHMPLPGDRGASQRAANSQPAQDEGHPSEMGQTGHAHPPRAQANSTRKKRKKKGRNNRATVRVASFNMKGFASSQSEGGGPTEKWLRINQIMRENKYGIMILQETHMDEERQQAIQNLFGRRLIVKASPDPTSPRQRAGIAAVLNRGEFDAEHAECTEVIPGRAIIVNATIHTGKKLTILGIYAPNNTTDNARFWDQIREYFEAKPNERRPDIMLGDFNVVEDAIDRLPARAERNTATEALDKLKQELRDIRHQ
ncbi:hypothetical protein EYR36_000117 [Pleurotus pulmonarius]|nr:hypothetical protein EYR36_000117 [Pleurotus pulmonarius]